MTSVSCVLDLAHCTGVKKKREQRTERGLYRIELLLYVSSKGLQIEVQLYLSRQVFTIIYAQILDFSSH